MEAHPVKMLELFSGTGSVSSAFARAGWDTYTVDWDPSARADLVADIGGLSPMDIEGLCGGMPDVVWASPDCTSYSVAAMGHHRRKNRETGELDPQTEYAAMCDRTNAHLLRLLEGIAPRYFFIENPRGGLRTMGFMKDGERAGFMTRYTVTYCQYGETRMKPTDIWTNHPDPHFRPPCRYGDPCHQRAPRGSRAGTQALGDKRERGRVPKGLCEHIVDICKG